MRKRPSLSALTKELHQLETQVESGNAVEEQQEKELRELRAQINDLEVLLKQASVTH
jgi:hypothetical protein